MAQLYLTEALLLQVPESHRFDRKPGPARLWPIVLGEQ